MAQSTATRYAQALHKVSHNNGAAELQQLMQHLQANPTVAANLANPATPVAERQKAVQNLVDSLELSPLVANFLHILAQTGQTLDLADTLQACQNILASEQGQVVVTVKTAVALNLEQKDELLVALRALMGPVPLILKEKIDPSVISGMALQFGSTVVDDTARGKLDQLEQTLQSPNNATGAVLSMADIVNGLKDKIANFNPAASVAEVGQVLNIGDGVVRIEGLSVV